MSAQQIAALEFVSVFEALSDSAGRAAALMDPRVQAARRRYLSCRATGVLIA